MTTFVMDLVKFERHNTHTTILWEPFNSKAPVARREYTGPHTLWDIIKAFNKFCVENDGPAKAQCTKHTEFNGYRACVRLDKGEKKPRGWNKSNSLRFEKEFKD